MHFSLSKVFFIGLSKVFFIGPIARSQENLLVQKVFFSIESSLVPLHESLFSHLAFFSK